MKLDPWSRGLFYCHNNHSEYRVVSNMLQNALTCIVFKKPQIGQDGDAVISAVASEQAGSGFEPGS